MAHVVQQNLNSCLQELAYLEESLSKLYSNIQQQSSSEETVTPTDDFINPESVLSYITKAAKLKNRISQISSKTSELRKRAERIQKINSSQSKLAASKIYQSNKTHVSSGDTPSASRLMVTAQGISVLNTPKENFNTVQIPLVPHTNTYITRESTVNIEKNDIILPKIAKIKSRSRRKQNIPDIN
ncbi:hypothetical protein BB561_000207 [Smittium simulii]|uniref:Uncharacterized protein n=1 Tax=Smittium simulii TaxID=133385 RepID=A0A2T9Z086_9FUNG|nr:hypothetical protein BB561_000207 [Smittium simulii]